VKTLSNAPMIRQYYTLLQLIKEIDSKLKGFVVVEAFSQEKNSVILSFFNPQNRESNYLFISVDSIDGTLYLDPQFTRKKSNVTDVFPMLLGKEFQFGSIEPNERVVALYFENVRVECTFYGGSNGSIGVYSPKNKLLEGIKVDSETKTQSFERVTFKSQFDEKREIKISKALSSSEFVLASFLNEEISSRTGINTSNLLNSVSSDEFSILTKAAIEIKNECLNSNQYYIISTGKEKILSVIPLKNHPTVLKEFDSISLATRYIRSIRKYETVYNQLWNSTNRYLTNSISKHISAITKINNEALDSKKAELYSKYADILFSLPFETKITDTPFVAESWDCREYSIPINILKTVVENAVLFKEKSSKSKKQQVIILERLGSTNVQLEKIKELYNKFQKIETLKELEQFVQKIGTKDNKTIKEHSSKFREFSLQNGYKVFVGKGASNNDELTFHFAKPNDIWLHARSVSGSHGVIKMNTKDKKLPSKEVLEEAASIVAYYSKSRNGTMVPVSYTYKKYVRKKKGFADGAVIMEREEVIFVEPKIPTEKS